MDRFETEIKKEVNDFLEKNIRFTHEEGERIRERIAPRKKRTIRFSPVYWTVMAAAASLFIFISISFISSPNGISIGNTTLLGFMNGEEQDSSIYKGKDLTIGVIGAAPEINEKQIAFQEISFEQFTIEEVRKFDAVFVMKESLSTAAEKQYTKIFTDSHIPFFFIDSNKGAYPFIEENLEYEEAAEIPYHNYFATGYLASIDGEEMTWTYEPSNEKNKGSFSAIFKTIEDVSHKTFNGNEDITDTDDVEISDGKDLTLVVERSGREDIQIAIAKLPVLLSYLTQNDNPDLEMSRLRSTFILTHQQKDYFLVSFNCGVKLCDQLLVEHSSKDEVQSIEVSESSILQDVKQQEDHLALLFGRTEGVAVVRNQIALLDLKEFIKFSPPKQLEVLESFEYPITRIEWKDNDLQVYIAVLEEPTFENIMEWNKNNGEPIQELLWEFK
ncbi:hypothetical protein [Sporosarcina koreensis]|uniref:DUF4179 domain-containing protein n=1 Tax=Sporosarcina koreensis TaxID=334735 RepID=A0ABW0U057_9BACL